MPEQRAQETLTLARSQHQPMTLAFALVVAQGIHLYRGEAAEAVRMGDEIVALSREYELKQETEWGRSFQGVALAALGKTTEGIDQLKDSLAVQQAIGSGLVRTAFLALLGEMLASADRIDEGLRAVDEGFAHAEKTLEGGYLAELHRVRGELLRRAGDDAAAEESLRRAIDRAIAQQAKSFELRAATDLANLLMAAGRRERRARGARARLRVVHRRAHHEGPRRRANDPGRDRIVTESGTPPLLIEQVLDEEYAFLHAPPDAPASPRGGRADAGGNRSAARPGQSRRAVPLGRRCSQRQLRPRRVAGAGARRRARQVRLPVHGFRRRLYRWMADRVAPARARARRGRSV